MAAILAGIFSVPLGIWIAGWAEIELAFTGAATVFLILFVFLPKIVRKSMKADTDSAIETFGKNEHVRKVFWAVFVAMAGVVLARVADPVTAGQIMNAILG